MVYYSAVQYGVMQYSTVWCTTVQYSAQCTFATWQWQICVHKWMLSIHKYTSILYTSTPVHIYIHKYSNTHLCTQVYVVYLSRHPVQGHEIHPLGRSYITSKLQPCLYWILCLYWTVNCGYLTVCKVHSVELWDGKVN